jgi:FAD/FMN-containing dehydrogenase
MVGIEGFSDNPEVLERYSKDFNLVPSGMNYVVKPKDVFQAQRVVQFAKEHRISMIPVSSGVHFYGATIPNQGGIILDLSLCYDICHLFV